MKRRKTRRYNFVGIVVVLEFFQDRPRPTINIGIAGIDVGIVVAVAVAVAVTRSSTTTHGCAAAVAISSFVWMSYNVEREPTSGFVAHLLPGVNGRIEFVLQHEYAATSAAIPSLISLRDDVPRRERNGKCGAREHRDPATGVVVGGRVLLLHAHAAHGILVAIDEGGKQAPDLCLAMRSAVAIVGVVPGRRPQEIDSQLLHLFRQRGLAGMVEVVDGAAIGIVVQMITAKQNAIVTIDCGTDLASGFVTAVAFAAAATSCSIVDGSIVNPSLGFAFDLIRVNTAAVVFTGDGLPLVLAAVIFNATATIQKGSETVTARTERCHAELIDRSIEKED
mmetsp:Transcript_10941/g.26290  ORF Transcript_10941/g.26290 Transcript_10941/m.26290 type:complete len:336 (+) Transcript_10941:1762-2769(+)